MYRWATADTTEAPVRPRYRGQDILPAMSPQEAASLMAGYTPADFLGVQSQIQNEFGRYSIGIFNESLYYAIYQSLVAPWLSLPAVLHLVQKVSNAISCLPMGMKNRKTGETHELLPALRMPLGTDNPSYHTPQMIEDICMSLFRAGCFGAVATVNDRGRPVRVTVVDTIRMQICGSFRRPYFHLYAGAIQIGASPTGPRGGDDQIIGDIWPGGRAGSPHRMLYGGWLRSPETMRGIPAALMAASTIQTAVSTEDYTASYYGDWQQLMISPKTQTDMVEAQATMDIVDSQIEANRRVVLSATEMVVDRLGLSARESEVVASRVADQGFLASVHGADASLVSNEASSFAQLYASKQMLRTDIMDPIMDLSGRELSRVCPPGWDFWYDKNALDRGDPKTMTDLAAAKVEKGLWSVNRALVYMGDEPYGDLTDDNNPYNRPTVNGNRMFLDMLEEKTKMSMQPKQQEKEPSDDGGRPDEGKTPPKPDYPNPPESE